MNNTYIKKFSPNASYDEIREFEIDIIGDPEKIVNNFSHYFSKIITASTDSLWVPKSTLAWKDLKYTQLNKIFLSNKQIFKSRACTIDKIYLIDFTNKKEKLAYKISLR